jgi:hypothetical protein
MFVHAGYQYVWKKKTQSFSGMLFHIFNGWQ